MNGSHPPTFGRLDAQLLLLLLSALSLGHGKRKYSHGRSPSTVPIPDRSEKWSPPRIFRNNSMHANPVFFRVVTAPPWSIRRVPSGSSLICLTSVVRNTSGAKTHSEVPATTLPHSQIMAHLDSWGPYQGRRACRAGYGSDHRHSKASPVVDFRIGGHAGAIEPSLRTGAVPPLSAI